MSTTPTKSKSGFTIIEVVLVLAIAGLIFMMVFLALPALQRSQRDTQRSDDIARLSAQLTQYKTDNRGALPGTGEAYVKATIDDNDTGTSLESKSDKWKNFYENYLLLNGKTTFDDPSAGPYNLSINTCKGEKENCNSISQTINTDISDKASGDTFDNQNNTITITTYAQCSGADVVYNNAARQVAIRYVKESGGVICISN